MSRALLAFLLSLAGCTETIRLEHEPLDQLVSLSIVPADASLEITALAPPHHTVQFSAIGELADGSKLDITHLVTWAIDRDALGGFDSPGLFVASHASVGRGTIAARVRNLQGTTGIRVRIATTIIDPVFPPPGSGLFAPPTPVISDDPTRSPSLIYPSDGTVMPSHIASTLFQLEPGADNTAYRITFDSDVLQLRVETGADRWRADGAVQQLIASSGVDPVRVSIEATAPGAPAIYAGPPIALAFSPELSSAPLLYWSAATNGIMRGGVDVTSASKLYPTSGTCVGCHSQSRNGTPLAVAVDDGTGSTFQLATIGLGGEPGLLPSPSRPMGWAAYSPDGKRLVVANDGVLTQYDGLTGTSLGTIPLPAGRFATHPDWSPDGTQLAIAYTSQAPTNRDVRGASIAVLPFANATWGAPEVVVGGSTNNNNYFPRWSPDGGYLAFVRASSASRGAADADLMLVDASGGTPIALATANHRVGTTDLPALANTMPAWGPRVGSRLWLAFASARPYGKVVTGGPSQIWITSLDLALPGDPTTPAFWLPCQDVTVLNSNPAWSAEQVTL